MCLSPWYRSVRWLGCLLAIPLLLPACETCPVFNCDAALADAGSKAYDIGTFLAAQRSDDVATGNTLLGQGGALGRWGAVSVSLRARRTSRAIPLTGGIHPQVNGAASSDFSTESAGAFAIGADAAIGLSRGWRAGGTRIGALDVIGSLSHVAGYRATAINATSDGNFVPGIGIRVGVLQESASLPGVSLSVHVRWLPSFSFHSAPMLANDGMQMSVGADDVSVSMGSVSLAASKRFGRFGATAGFGSDNSAGDGSFSVTRGAQGGTTTTAVDGYRWSVQRANAFIGASYDLGRATVAAELGHLSGGGSYSPTANTFGGRPINAGRSYLTMGVRLDLQPRDESANAGTRTRMP